jgi:hypothetical protein
VGAPGGPPARGPARGPGSWLRGVAVRERGCREVVHVVGGSLRIGSEITKEGEGYPYGVW